MDAARHARAKALFLAVRELPAGERAGELERAAGGDAALVAEVQSLLAFDTPAEILAERPAPVATTKTGGGDPLGLVGVTLDDRYRVDALVSEGGFGYVYRAEQVRWGRPAAIKVFKLERGDEAIKQAFIKEGALLSELSRHTTAIVQSYDVGTWVDGNGRPRVFTVLEWLDGRTLGEEMAEARRAPPGTPRGWPMERVIEVLGPIAEALGVAHARGIAHRDVKPANIFLVEQEGRRVTKLLDFGVAKVAAEHEAGFQSTGGNIAAFTVGYAAPEQLSRRHGTSGPWTDVYSLALVCVELLAGRRAFDSDDPLAATKRFTMEAPPPTPGNLGLAVSAEVDEVFERALAPDAADRYPDAATFWHALVTATGQRARGGEGRGREAGKARRVPWALVGGVLAAAALLGAWLALH